MARKWIGAYHSQTDEQQYLPAAILPHFFIFIIEDPLQTTPGERSTDTLSEEKKKNSGSGKNGPCNPSEEPGN